MKLTNHAKSKLEIYEVPENEIVQACDHPIYELYDVKEETKIKIVEYKGTLFAVVCDEEKIITVYTTDEKTITNRQKNKRWT